MAIREEGLADLEPPLTAFVWRRSSTTDWEESPERLLIALESVWKDIRAFCRHNSSAFPASSVIAKWCEILEVRSRYRVRCCVRNRALQQEKDINAWFSKQSPGFLTQKVRGMQILRKPGATQLAGRCQNQKDRQKTGDWSRQTI